MAALIHSLLDLLRSFVLGFLAVDEVQAAGLGLFIDEGTGESGDDFFGFGVAGRFSCQEGVRYVILYSEIGVMNGGRGNDGDWGQNVGALPSLTRCCSYALSAS